MGFHIEYANHLCQIVFEIGPNKKVIFAKYQAEPSRKSKFNFYGFKSKIQTSWCKAFYDWAINLCVKTVLPFS